MVSSPSGVVVALAGRHSHCPSVLRATLSLSPLPPLRVMASCLRLRPAGEYQTATTLVSALRKRPTSNVITLIVSHCGAAPGAITSVVAL